MSADPAFPAFSRPVVVESLSSGSNKRTLEANEAERAALARRFDLQRLERLEATVTLKPINRRALIRLSGHLSAEVVQSCVVTLEPVASRIDEDFTLSFSHEINEADADVELSLEEDDPPDPIENGVIDLGEVVAEQLALAIDPFPRKPGAEFIPPQEENAATPDTKPTKSPFEALVRLVPKEK